MLKQKAYNREKQIQVTNYDEDTEKEGRAQTGDTTALTKRVIRNPLP